MFYQKNQFNDIYRCPIHILIGELDDWTPALACEELVDMVEETKSNINVTVYENSHHGFDSDENIPL